MKFRTLLLSTLVALAGTQARADNMASIAISPATGAVTLTPRWAIGGSLVGFHEMAQDLSLGGGANQFYSIKGTAIPSGGDIAAFTLYIAASGAATNHADIGSKLTPNAYSALTSADPDVGYGAVNFYFIHHKASGDYFSVIKPSSGVASAVADLKPMSGPGGPATLGASGYFGLTFAAADLGYGPNNFYYFRTDAVTGFTKFGTLAPPLLGTSTDKFDLGIAGHNALTFTGTDVGFGASKMYYARLDPITGFTIFGTLDPLTGRAADIANLGSVFSTLDFVPGDVGFGAGQFYTTGAVNPMWQSVSFAAIADRAISAGSFTVSPSAGSGLAITLTVVPGSAGSASISAPVGGVFTITPTAPGLITLQASQAGQAGVLEFNMLRQGFTASGVAVAMAPVITNSVLTATGSPGTPFTYAISASGSPTSYSATPLPAGLVLNTATGVISGTPTTAGTTVVLLGAMNATGTANATLTVVVAAAGSTPVITNSVLTAAGSPGTPFNYAITAAGSPTSYSATPLPAGLVLNTATGIISGIPTTAGTTVVLLGATNASGTANATLTVVVAATGSTPVIINNPLAGAAATLGAPFSYTITAAGSPTSYSATPLPAGLSLATATGVISGIPTTTGTTVVQLGATNASGTGTSTLTITVAAINVAPIITSPTSAPGVAGTPFVTFTIAGTGQPTGYTATGLPPGLTINPLTGAINGTPTVAGTYNVTITATNSSGTTTATLTIVITAGSSASSRIVNFSARALSGPGSQSLVMGFAVSGNGKNLLVRGIGPTLASFGIVNVLADPLLTLFDTNGSIATNDDWGTDSNGVDQSAHLAAVAAQFGAFALPVGSKDSALLFTVNNGAHTTSLLRPNSTTGVALTEIYDIDATAGARLTNVSARMNVTTGEGTLIAGLVIAGNAPKTVLIRGVGPTLAAFGVTGVLADPQITVFAGGIAIASNDNWETGPSTAAQIIAASAQVGAFPLPAGSLDAAVLITLQPGAYTMQVTGNGNTTGVALIEVYDTQ